MRHWAGSNAVTTSAPSPARRMRSALALLVAFIALGILGVLSSVSLVLPASGSQPLPRGSILSAFGDGVPTCPYDSVAHSVPARTSGAAPIASHNLPEGVQGTVATATGSLYVPSSKSVAADSGILGIKPGAAGGPTAGNPFPAAVRAQALAENPSTCVFCRMMTDTPQVDHAIPRVLGGDATIENGQTACPFCNASKGPRPFPVNPPPDYVGRFPPAWWTNRP